MTDQLVIGNKTYIYDAGGKLAQVQDNTSDPMSLGLPKPKSVVPNNVTSDALNEGFGNTLSALGVPDKAVQGVKTGTFPPGTLKDISVDAASQLPLYLMSGGGAGKTLLKGGASLLAGTTMDQLVNGANKSVGESGEDAAVNTLVGMGLNHLIQNPPNPSQFDKAKGWGVRGIVGGIIKSLQGQPLLEEVPETTPVIKDKLTGKWKSNKAAWQEFQDYKKKKGYLDAISNLLGFGANSAIDYENDKQ